MRKLMLFGFVLLLVVGGLLGFAVYNLNDLVNQNKEQLLAQAEQTLGRKVKIGEIELTFWGGIGARLQNFSLADDPAFSSDTFVQAADLQVNVKLMPLLNQEIEVKRVILHDPVIRVIRNAQGVFNFASLSGGETPATPPDASETTASSGSGDISLLVALVNITNGDIRYTDQQEKTELRVSQLDLKVEDLSFDKPLSLTLAAAIISDQQNFQLDGTFGPLGKEIQVDTLAIDGSITLDPLDIAAVQKALPQVAEAIPPGLGISGPVRISSQLSGTAGALMLSDLQLTASVFESSEANVKVTGDVGPLSAEMEALTLNTDIAFGPVGLPQLFAFAPVAENLPPELSADGPASVNAHVEGTLKNLTLTATVEATESSIQFGDQFQKPQGKRLVLSTAARITPESVAVQQAKIQLHTLELTSSGNVTLGDTLGVDLQLDSNVVDLAGWQEILPQLQELSPTGQIELHTHIKGDVGEEQLPDITGTLDLHQVSTNLAQLLTFAPVAENLPPELSADGPASVTAHVDVEGSLKNVALTATIEATESSIQFGDQFQKPQGKRLVLSTAARMTPESVAVQQAKIQLHTLELTSSGNVTLGDTLGVDLQLDSNVVDLAGWQEILPQLQELSPTGQMELHTHIKGQMAETQLPDITGTFDVRQVSASIAQLPQPVTDVNTNITFTGQGADIKNTSVQIGQSVLRLAAKVARFMPLDATYTFTSPELRLADVQASAGAGGAEVSSDILKTLKSEGTVRMQNEQLAFTGTVSSAQGTMANVDYTNFQTALSLLNEVAKIKSLRLQTLGGSVNASGQYNMGATPPQFQVTSQISDIELGEVFRTQMSNALQYVRGKANFNLDLVGNGADWEAMKPTLQGQGKFEVNQGALVDLNIADEVLSNITGIPGLTSIVSQKVRKKYPAIFGGTDTEFADLGSNFTFSEGKILLDDVHLNAVDYSTQGEGWLDYEQQIDFHGQVVLAENLSKDIQNDVKLAKYISNNQGRIAIPFALSGTLPDAKPLPDIAALTHQVQQGAVQKGIEAVQEKILDKILPSTSSLLGLGGKAGQESEQSQGEEEEGNAPPPPTKPEDLLKEGLKGLFGR